MSGLLRSLLLHQQRFYTSLTIPSEDDGLVVELWDRPGQWLPDDEFDRLVQAMRTVALAGQRGKPLPVYGALKGERADLARRCITLVSLKKTGEPIGFCALAYFDIPLGVRVLSVVHLGLLYVVPDHQHRHLSNLLYGASTMLLLMKSGLRGFWISNVSQVPAAVGLTARHYDNVYPRPGPKARQSFMHLVLAREIMKAHRPAFGVGPEAGFDEARQIITNAYTGGSDALRKTWDEAPRHRDPAINELCRTTLNYDRGDDLLQLGRCNLRSIWRLFASKLPKNAAVEVAWRAMTIVAFGLVSPAVRWLIAPEYDARGQPLRANDDLEVPR
jgi:hypothetical protein